MKRFLLAACLVTATVAHAQTTADELASGAAAATVLILVCEPPNYAAVYQLAVAGARERAYTYSSAQLAGLQESIDRKVKAFAASSQGQPCASLTRLRSIALNWGFANLVRDPGGAAGLTPVETKITFSDFDEGQEAPR